MTLSDREIDRAFEKVLGLANLNEFFCSANPVKDASQMPHSIGKAGDLPPQDLRIKRTPETGIVSVVNPVATKRRGQTDDVPEEGRGKQQDAINRTIIGRLLEELTEITAKDIP